MTGLTAADRLALLVPSASARGPVAILRIARGVPARWSRSRLVAVLSAAISLGFVLAVVAYAVRHAYTSDDVAVQDIVSSILSGSRFEPVVGGDNFLVKVPVYLLVGWLVPNGALALTATVLLCNAPLVAALLLLANRVTADRSRLATASAFLLVAWFLVVRIADMSSLMIPNGRNGEIGAVLLLLWWRVRAGAGRPGRSSVVAVAAFALLFFSDGFFPVVIGASCAVLLAIAWAVHGPGLRSVGRLTGEVLLAAAISTVAGKAAALAGVQTLQNYMNVIPSASDLPGMASASFGALARNLNGDPTGRALGVGVVPGVLQVVLLLVLVGLAVRVGLRAFREDRPFAALLLVMTSVNLILYVATSNAADRGSFRYLLFAAVLLVVVGCLGVGALDGRRLRSRLAALVAGIGVLAVMLGAGMNARNALQWAAGALGDPQSRTHQVIDVAERHGLAVGAGDYWDANVTTYFSAGSVRVMPVACGDGAVTAAPWLINRAVAEERAPRMFFVLRAESGCTPEIVRKALGAPAERVPLHDGTGDAVWIYGRSIP